MLISRAGPDLGLAQFGPSRVGLSFSGPLRTLLLTLAIDCGVKLHSDSSLVREQSERAVSESSALTLFLCLQYCEALLYCGWPEARGFFLLAAANQAGQ